MVDEYALTVPSDTTNIHLFSFSISVDDASVTALHHGQKSYSFPQIRAFLKTYKKIKNQNPKRRAERIFFMFFAACRLQCFFDDGNTFLRPSESSLQCTKYLSSFKTDGLS